MSADTISDTEESVIDDSSVDSATREVEATEEVEAADEADDADDADEKAADEKAAAGEKADDEGESRLSRLRKLRIRPSLSWRTVAALLLLAAIGGAFFGYRQYDRLNHEVVALKQAESDRAAAAKLAKEYALKSLTYTYENPDAFFQSVEDGVSQSLKDKYVNATPILKGVMVQAQVTSSGEVLATDAVAQPGDVYQVVVSAAQTTRNLQNPKPRVSLILLQITVNKVDGSWQVSDIGPKTGSHAGNADQLPPPVPSPAPAPAPAPAPRR